MSLTGNSTPPGEWLPLLVNNLASAALLEDSSRKVLLVNQRFCDLFAPGSTPDKLIGIDGAHTLELARSVVVEPEAYRERLERVLSHSLAVIGDTFELFDGRVFERDYSPVTVDGVVIGHFWTYREITQQHQAIVALKTAKDEADRASSSKDLFVAALSHEMRSNLHLMLGNIDLLRETHLSENQLSLLRSIRSVGRSQLSLMSDLLDLSALRAGTFSLEEVPFCPKDVVSDVLTAFNETAKGKNIVLDLEWDDRLPQLTRGDDRRLGQILTNLVANAVRFCDKGHVLIRAIRAAASQNASLLRFEVEDTGTGVPVEEETRLFSPFHRVSDINKRRGGTGLGLAISKQLTEAMGGAIGHFPTPGGGATFWFTVRVQPLDPHSQRHFPRRYSPTPSSIPIPVDLQNIIVTDHAAGLAPRTTEPESESDATVVPKRTVLVVEDTAANRLWAKRVLESRNFLVIEASSGEDAIELAKRQLVDLVLMDWQMPGLDGIDTTKAIRGLGGSWLQIPILGLSANARPEDLQTCINAGMNDCLFKPVSAKDLVNAVQNFIKASKNRANTTTESSQTFTQVDIPPQPAPGPKLTVPTASPATQLAPAARSTRRPSVDFSVFRGLDAEAVAELTDLFAESVRSMCSQATTAARNHDQDQVKKVLHQLIGMTGNVGYLGLSQDIRQIYERCKTELYFPPLDELQEICDRCTTAAKGLKEAWQKGDLKA